LNHRGESNCDGGVTNQTSQKKKFIIRLRMPRAISRFRSGRLRYADKWFVARVFFCALSQGNSGQRTRDGGGEAVAFCKSRWRKASRIPTLRSMRASIAASAQWCGGLSHPTNTLFKNGLMCSSARMLRALHVIGICEAIAQPYVR
jgi:hypothetical protein